MQFDLLIWVMLSFLQFDALSSPEPNNQILSETSLGWEEAAQAFGANQFR